MSAKVVRVGVAAIIRREGRILMGKRKGSHGAGSWSFPGGHLEPGETVAECAARETFEEAGFKVDPRLFRKLTFTNDIFTVEDKHYITLYVEATWPGVEARIMEPTKCEEWRWASSPQTPLFLPIQNLLEDGFNPWEWDYDGKHPSRPPMTWLELAKEEAAKLGVILTDDAADFLLWERTLFPMCGEDECRRQVAEEIEANWKNFDPKTSGPTFWDKLGED